MAYEDLILGFRFGVFFFVGGVLPNPLDIRFKRVSGLSGRINTIDLREGGQNIYTHKLPDGVDHDNLVLERGMVVGSPLNIEVNVALSLYAMTPSNVMITLFGEDMVPLSAWLCIKAFPVRWSTSDLDAGEGGLVIDTFELAYTRLQMLRI
jgi:phage tail-like protein